MLMLDHNVTIQRKRERATSVCSVQPSPLRKKTAGSHSKGISEDQLASSSTEEEPTSDPPVFPRDHYDCVLPKVSFNLITHADGTRKLYFLQKKHHDEIFRIYPGCLTIESEGFFLMLHFASNNSPVKPWPVMLGGYAVYFTDQGARYPSWYGSFGKAPRILEKWSQMNFLETSAPEDILESIFRAIPKAVSISHLGLVLCIELETDDLNGDLLVLPRMIGNHRVTYKRLQSVEANRIARRAKHRRIRVVGDEADNHDYSPNLIPGIMLGSVVRDPIQEQARPVRQGTTQGIAVLSTENAVSVLVAEHGFRYDENITDTVWHPSDSGNAIGTIVARDRNSDFALFKLSSGFSCNNREYFGVVGARSELSFTSEALEGTQPLVFDSPWSGPVYSCYIGTKYFRLHEYDEAVTRQVQMIIYIGNGAEDPRDGVCGATIFTTCRDEEAFKRQEEESADVQYAITQFHLYDGDGLAYGPDFSSLAHSRYRIAQDRVEGAGPAHGII